MSHPYDLAIDKELLNYLLNTNTHPIVISFTDIHGNLISTPVWSYYHQDDGYFYMFTSKNSMKVRAIEQGNTEFGLIIINKNSFPVVRGEELPYLSMTGIMRLVTLNDVPDLNSIHIRLLEKYLTNDQDQWVIDLIEKLKGEPEDTWMLRYTPTTIRTY